MMWQKIIHLWRERDFLGDKQVGTGSSEDSWRTTPDLHSTHRVNNHNSHEQNQTKSNEYKDKIKIKMTKYAMDEGSFICPGFSNLTLEASTRCLRMRRENWSKTVKWGNMVNIDDPAWIHNSLWTCPSLSSLYHLFHHFCEPSGDLDLQQAERAPLRLLLIPR